MSCSMASSRTAPSAAGGDHTFSIEDTARVVQLEGTQRWHLQYQFRSILSYLLLATSSVAAAMQLVPGLYSGCDTTLNIVSALTVLVLIPALLVIANRTCHHYDISHQRSKHLLMTLLAMYYLPIVYVDSQTHVMVDGAPTAMNGESTIASWYGACESFFFAPGGNRQSTNCTAIIETAQNHASETMMLADIATNFFVCACLLESWGARALHVVGHATLWVGDNLTYPRYTTLGTTAERTWHWISFVLVEAQMMGTVVAIAFAVDVIWLAQRAQARLEARVMQIENEKERLQWESLLSQHRAVSAATTSSPPLRLEPLGANAHEWHAPMGALDDSSCSSTTNTLFARSHHTAKLGNADDFILATGEVTHNGHLVTSSDGRM